MKYKVKRNMPIGMTFLKTNAEIELEAGDIGAVLCNQGFLEKIETEEVQEEKIIKKSKNK